ncbi:glycosyltransferase involved in cell wall biosynthesis [Sediminihabitans luteus]|uniref:Glycosyltransferase involved in cell wall biosynthesis n=1 Tax=Sediminihabitans luteus TaxID=1138585 RepID=A0A2M9CD55_9CELL|nr:DUF1972 domain-containing protein [Sediminihabitans luteus]PJJ69866.1 glycosyltransferase involved in cell wall biosynthesis [Sediminihabitans luteus]GII99185.1 glycosyl transferase [Sediminihabitans luteus]
MVGTRGVPARYGGFETAVEEIGTRLAARGHAVRVYCRRGNSEAMPEYQGMRLVTLPVVRRRSLETLLHTGLSVGHLASHRTDVAFVFNAANSPWLPVLRAARIPVATHVDGLEWKRAKWSVHGQRYYRWAEGRAVRWSDALIADADGIARYYEDEFGAQTRTIAYGAPAVARSGLDRLDELGLRAGGYHLVVARFEPENHVDVVVEGYVRSSARLPLVVVGSAPYSDAYTAKVQTLGDDPRVHLLGGVWDQELLDGLYAGAASYLHGHSVGGTNPSLLRAIGAGTPTVAYDVVFNREVLRSAGRYFRTPDDVARAVEKVESDPASARSDGAELSRRARDYDWDDVADGYERLARDLLLRDVPGPQRARRAAGRSDAPAGAPS